MPEELMTVIRPRVEMYLPTPDNIASLTAWWRASDLRETFDDGDAVTAWPDRVAGREWITTEEEGVTEPQVQRNQFNGKDTLHFNGNKALKSDFLWDELLGSGGVGTILVVGRSKASAGVAAGDQPIMRMASPQQLGLFFITGAVQCNLNALNNDFFSPTLVGDAQTFAYKPSIWMWGHDTSNSYVGANVADTAYSLDTADLDDQAGHPLTNLNKVMFLGSGNGLFLTGDISDILVFNTFLTEEERQGVARDLCTHYRMDYTGTVPVPDSASPYWVNVSEDVISDVKAQWGIHGNSPKDRMADVGTMSFDMDDNTTNSGGVRGYYSPGALHTRPGFGIGTHVRLVLSHALYGDKVRWQGTIDSPKPKPGVADPRVSVSCVDWLEEAGRDKLANMAVQTNQQSDVYFGTLVAAVQNQPPNGTRVGSGSDIYPYVLDNVQDESTKVAGELARLAASEFGIIYVDAGTAVFEGRLARGGEGSVRFALNDLNMTAVGVAYDRSDIVNRVQVAVHPRRVDSAATTVLFTLGSVPLIVKGTTQTMSCQYRDPAQVSQRVGGKDMVTPVATTDYTFNTLADGTGTNITSQLTVAYDGTPGGNTAVVLVTNNGPLDGYLTFFRLRGRGLYDFEPVIADQRDASSVGQYGENPLTFDMPLQGSTDNGKDVAQYILLLNKDPKARVVSATFVANWNDENTSQAFNLNVSDRVSITLDELSLDAAQFFVNGFTMNVRMSGLVVLTVALAPVDESKFWVLEVAGRSELDLTTVLGFGLFTPGWILDTSNLGVNTFLN